MVQLQNFIKQCFKLTLMWVMLLWALTLPGQEVAVYNFLLGGSLTPTLAQITYSDTAIPAKISQQAVQAFVDAKPSSSVQSTFQQVLKHPAPFAFEFAFSKVQSILKHSLAFAGRDVLTHILPISIQPNAP